MAVKRSPTGKKLGIRHWILYHNPSTMGVEFYDLPGFDCVTNRRVRDLAGDVVWVIGRPSSSTRQFYLDSRFRIEEVMEGEWDGFRYRLCARTGLLFFPPVRVDAFPWFKRLYRQTAGFSTGFQAIYDSEICAGLNAVLASSFSVQTNLFTPAETPTQVAAGDRRASDNEGAALYADLLAEGMID